MKITKPLLEHKKNLLLLLASSWTVIIAVLCLIKTDRLPTLGIGISGLDKIVHVIMHFVFTMLWSGYLKTNSNFGKIQAIQVGFASLLYGIAIEVAQAVFTTSRKADFTDVCANSVGAILAIGLLLVSSNRIKN